jgi:hypothetical protein
MAETFTINDGGDGNGNQEEQYGESGAIGGVLRHPIGADHRSRSDPFPDRPGRGGFPGAGRVHP